MIGGSIVGDVLYSIATGEEEGRSRARILAFAAKRYQTAVERNPRDYDALYNWALVLQESADNSGPEAGLQGKDALLEEACRKYQAASVLCGTLHEVRGGEGWEADSEEVDREEADREEADREEVDREEADREEADREEVDREEVDREEADREEVDREEVDREEVDREEVDRRMHEAFYNWAIAISDRAKIRGRTAEAEDLWKQATLPEFTVHPTQPLRNPFPHSKYERAVHLYWDHPPGAQQLGAGAASLGGRGQDAFFQPTPSELVHLSQPLPTPFTHPHHQACSKYERAVQLNWDSPQALNNCLALCLSEPTYFTPHLSTPPNSHPARRAASMSRQRACSKYERAVQLNWDSPQELNNWGLALQEDGNVYAPNPLALGSCTPPNPSQLPLPTPPGVQQVREGSAAELGLAPGAQQLGAGAAGGRECACSKYERAVQLNWDSPQELNNWGLALQEDGNACSKYERAVQLNWDSPQALNNWGLALQELSTIVPAKDKRKVVRKAINKFRAAIRLRYDFHRAIYNLGTVLYGLAEDTMKQAKSKTGVMPDRTTHPANEVYSQSAVYIAAAHALKADYPVYRNALRLVRTMLPLPYLKGGYLTVPPGGNSLAPHAEWLRLWFVLDHERLKEGKKPEPKQPHSNLTSRRNTANSQTSVTASIVPKPEPAPPTAAAPAAPANAGTAGSAAATSDGGRWSSDAMGGRPNLSSSVEDAVSALPPPPIQVDIGQIVSVEACADLSLPAGGGIVLDTVDGPFYMVADDWDSMDAWVDAIRLVYTIYVRGKSEDLAAVLAA
ncbi:unnamed protein product [Closterium sp. NIES-65]|nr:unnamed protein product [Closterium sp. NIES-65]